MATLSSLFELKGKDFEAKNNQHQIFKEYF
jgi:hypothetical protein